MEAAPPELQCRRCLSFGPVGCIYCRRGHAVPPLDLASSSYRVAPVDEIGPLRRLCAAHVRFATALRFRRARRAAGLSPRLSDDGAQQPPDCGGCGLASSSRACRSPFGCARRCRSRNACGRTNSRFDSRSPAVGEGRCVSRSVCRCTQSRRHTPRLAFVSCNWTLHRTGSVGTKVCFLQTGRSDESLRTLAHMVNVRTRVKAEYLQSESEPGRQPALSRSLRM